MDPLLTGVHVGSHVEIIQCIVEVLLKIQQSSVDQHLQDQQMYVCDLLTTVYAIKLQIIQFYK